MIANRGRERNKEREKRSGEREKALIAFLIFKFF